MKKVFALLSCLVLLSLLAHAAGAPAIFAYRPAASSFDETRDVSNFSGLASSGSYSVYVKIGVKESLRLEGDEDLISKTETVVEDGILHIRTKKEFQNRGMNFKSVKVYVTAKELNTLVVSGSGSIKVEDRLKADDFTATVSGSGSIDAAGISANALTAKVSGSGSLETSGTAKEATVRVSGSGSFNGKNFRTDVADVQVSGSGDVYIQAENTLDGRLSGSGKIYYSGNPKVTEKKSGSGRLVKM
jgi:hypothetical protein